MGFVFDFLHTFLLMSGFYPILYSFFHHIDILRKTHSVLTLKFIPLMFPAKLTDLSVYFSLPVFLSQSTPFYGPEFFPSLPKSNSCLLAFCL